MKINFIYSSIYDNLLTEMSRKEFSAEQMKEMEFYKEELEASWRKEERKITREIEKISGLKFKGGKNCFIVKNMKYVAISMPLTIKKDQRITRAKTTLIHELVHIIMNDNTKKLKKIIENIYPEENMDFKIHVPVLLITRKVIEKIYSEKIFEEILNSEMKIFGLNSAWSEANSIYSKFKGNITKFLKNEKLY